MAFLEFVIGLFVFILVVIVINVGIFIYKLYNYGKNNNDVETNSIWNTAEIGNQNSTELTEVSIPCTISANVRPSEGLGPNRRLSELVVRDGQLVLINYSTGNGKVHLQKLLNGPSTSNSPYEDLPPAYELCVQP